MKRLSLEELKAQKTEQVTQNLENISGGNTDWCHVWDILTTPSNWIKAIGSGPGDTTRFQQHN